MFKKAQIGTIWPILNIPNCLTELVCSKNFLTELDNLPDSIKSLNANSNPKLSNLDNLPSSLEKLIFNGESIRLDIVPLNLKEIYCSQAQYEKLSINHEITKKVKIIKFYSNEK